MYTSYSLKIFTVCAVIAFSFLVTVSHKQVFAQDSLEALFQELDESASETVTATKNEQAAMPAQNNLQAPSDSTPSEDPFAEFQREMGLLDDTAGDDVEATSDMSLNRGQQDVKTPEDLEAEIREEAFNAAVNGLLPLRPEEIRRFLEIYDEVRQASNTRIYPYPKPENKVAQISLDPYDEPEVVKLAAGLVTTISMLDATGQNWPISNMTWAGDFEVIAPDEGGHRVRITPLSEYAYGNISMTFEGLSAPVVLTLATQREMAHMRFDARIPALGPFAKPPLMTQSGPRSQAGTAVVVSVLDGTLPNNAEMMDVIGADGRTKAYKLNGSVYLRTPLTLISPSWTESATSADGTNVYVLGDTPVVLLSEKGKVVRAFLSEKEQNL